MHCVGPGGSPENGSVPGRVAAGHRCWAMDCVSHRAAKVVHPGQTASVLIYEHVLRDARLIL